MWRIKKMWRIIYNIITFFIKQAMENLDNYKLVCMNIFDWLVYDYMSMKKNVD